MDAPNDHYARTRFASGMRTIALIVMLIVVALAVDHAFFVAPRAHRAAAQAHARDITPAYRWSAESAGASSRVEAPRTGEGPTPQK